MPTDTKRETVFEHRKRVKTPVTTCTVPIRTPPQMDSKSLYHTLPTRTDSIRKELIYPHHPRYRKRFWNPSSTMNNIIDNMAMVLVLVFPIMTIRGIIIIILLLHLFLFPGRIRRQGNLVFQPQMDTIIKLPCLRRATCNLHWFWFHELLSVFIINKVCLWKKKNKCFFWTDNKDTFIEVGAPSFKS